MVTLRRPATRPQADRHGWPHPAVPVEAQVRARVERHRPGADQFVAQSREQFFQGPLPGGQQDMRVVRLRRTASRPVRERAARGQPGEARTDDDGRLPPRR
jgi:hypothetical protein